MLIVGILAVLLLDTIFLSDFTTPESAVVPITRNIQLVQKVHPAESLEKSFKDRFRPAIINTASTRIEVDTNWIIRNVSAPMFPNQQQG